MKKVLAIILSAMLAVSVVGCASTTAAPSASPSAGSKAESKATESKVAAVKDSGALGDYTVAIESARMSKDYQSKPAIIVKYKFTNNGDKTVAFMAAVMGKAFQDGVELENAMVTDDKAYNANNYMKDIKKGASIEVECCYALANKKSKVDVEATELISVDDNKLAKTFDVSKLK